jgi:hypothetical protein
MFAIDQIFPDGIKIISISWVYFINYSALWWYISFI